VARREENLEKKMKEMASNSTQEDAWKAISRLLPESQGKQPAKFSIISFLFGATVVASAIVSGWLVGKIHFA